MALMSSYIYKLRIVMTFSLDELILLRPTILVSESPANYVIIIK